MPLFVRPTLAEPEIGPAKVAVTAGPETVSVRVAAPRAVTPASVRLLAARLPPKVALPLKVTALSTVAALAPLISVVPSATVKPPRPSGPPVRLKPPVEVGAVLEELAPRINVPPVSVRPVRQLLVVLVRTKEPLPVLLMAFVLPTFWVTWPLMMSPIGDRPLTLMTGLALLNSREAPVFPLIVGVKARLSLTEVMAAAAESTMRLSWPAAGLPRASVGVATPPILPKVRLARVL